MKKILVLVMYCNKDLFERGFEWIKNNWAKPVIDGKYPNIQFFGYTASKDGKYHIDYKRHIIQVPCDDELFGTAEKTIKTFRFIHKLGLEYDYIFRTNTSTYINIPLMNLLVLEIYDEECVWAGILYASTDKGGPYPFCVFPCGKGIIMSKKLIDYVLRIDSLKYAFSIDLSYEFNRLFPEVYKIEDAAYKVDDNFLGLILNSYFIGKRQENHLKHYKQFGIIGANENITYQVSGYIDIAYRVWLPNDNEAIARKSKEFDIALSIQDNIKKDDTDMSLTYEFINDDFISVYGFSYLQKPIAILLMNNYPLIKKIPDSEIRDKLMKLWKKIPYLDK